MTQNLVVGLVVVAASLYSAWVLLPAAVRRACSAWLATLARRCGIGEEETLRLQATLANHSSCGECQSCKGCSIGVAGKPPTAVPLPQSGLNRGTAQSNQ